MPRPVADTEDDDDARAPRTSTSRQSPGIEPVSHERIDGYLPIGSYGLIGDCRSAALVGVDGSIDWLCLPRFDDDALFGRILDAEQGWELAAASRTSRTRSTSATGTGPTSSTPSSRRAPAWLSSRTSCRCDERSVVQHAKPHNHPRVIRLVECLAGEMTMHQVFDPAPGFARAPVTLTSWSAGSSTPIRRSSISV